MDRDRDLLPWIFGGLLMATAAIVITAASTKRTAPASIQAPSEAFAYTLPPAPADNAPAPTPPASASAPTLPAAQVQTATPPMPSTNRIWECITNGQRTFSSNPCGHKSSIREIGPINGMDPTPLLPPARPYVPQSDYDPDYAYPGTQGAAENSYPTAVVIPFIERRRPEHAHRPYRHDRGPAARKN
jgi:hypothetical protein